MRLVIQRANKAKVVINNQLYASISKGLVVLLGIEEDDDLSDIKWLVKKLVNMRIFPDEKHPINASIEEVNGEFLVVSQFTLHASTKKGNRPSFIKAASPKKAEELYLNFLDELSLQTKLTVKSGKFGASMDIDLVNHGPVTILIDSKNKE
ncbi:MAG: D-tyrosyl-tRNA(Tyr) deacylase [Flavobacteriaceae bacterium]|nr:D-tyrosyl-tRNA(Tyr) deacylase [Flavobacteriaceae bacterium]